MNYFGTERRLDLKTPFGIEDTLVDENQRHVAIAAGAMLLGAAILAGIFGRGAGPELKPLLLVCATIWSLADVLVAALFLIQFYVSGRTFFGILSAAYAVMCFLTWGYLAVFPGLFSNAKAAPGGDQLPTLLWCAAHCLFPVLVAVAALTDAPSRRFTERKSIAIATAVFAVAPLVFAALTFVIAAGYQNALPPLVVDGTFQSTYRIAVLPVVAMLNASACFCIFARSRSLTPVMLWIGVSTLSATLETLMVEVSDSRFTYAYDVGKIIAVVSVCVVLVMFLCEIAGLYERLVLVARTDVLASLDDRRAFDLHLAGIVQKAQRFQHSIGLLFIDIDAFDRFEDPSGAVTPEACLRRIAHALAGCAPHASALVPRDGRAEFAIVLPDVTLDQALAAGERVRVAIENLGIPHAAAARGLVTVSVGLAYAAHALDAEAYVFAEAAERAVYEAKDRGGNVLAGNLVEFRHAA